MKFLCVGYLDPVKMQALAPAEVDALLAECPPFMEEFHRSGKVTLVVGVPGEARSLRRVGGEVRATAERPAEAVGCVFLVEAADLEEATRVAALHPTTRLPAGERLGFRIGISPVHHYDDHPR